MSSGIDSSGDHIGGGTVRLSSEPDPEAKRSRPDQLGNLDVIDTMYLSSRLVFGQDGLPTNCVCELYSPPRVDPIAQQKGFSAGISMDKISG